jgi:hypothetical protein
MIFFKLPLLTCAFYVALTAVLEVGLWAAARFKGMGSGSVANTGFGRWAQGGEFSLVRCGSSLFSPHGASSIRR